MQRCLKILLTATLALAAGPLLAQRVGNGQVLVLPLTTGLTTGEMARVLTSGGQPAECLAPLAVTRIDGEMRTVSAQGFLIEPGVHTINGKATLDLTNCPLIDANLDINSTDDLEVDFEPGGTYYIAYYHAPVNPEEWKLVVWHIEKSPRGE
jgi:hypothetical protein